MYSSSESVVAKDDFNKPGPSKMYVKQPTRGSIDFIMPKHAAALDKCKISDRDTVHILISTAEALGQKSVDRLPIITLCNGESQLLGVPAIDTGTGVDQPDAVFHLFIDWCITENAQAFCCDTTASNMGKLKGTCVLLENYLELNILYLPCRHHIYELILKCVFEVKLYLTSGPDVPIFKRFQQNWRNIDTNKFEPGIMSDIVKKY
ncbi:uncharacterized protein LOC126894353 [Daktulosphaira vitifoliae]|uniref:uncharacterized protein LOC126894353 n=1 Tax=Daktulosphaira vitifoliae TaxID=58002 RepID=UPI0021AA3ADA|nr:uncharacterized protein LOC126894353 [Daktulosphaira vitifoliae]